MNEHLLASMVVLLLIACVVAIIARWLKQPYTVALVIVGLIVAITKVTPDISISHNVTFMIVLPPLLFQGALHMDLSQLKENWKSIALLAVPGVIVSTFVIGLLLHNIWGIGLLSALLLGSILTPTDPISVLAILKQTKTPRRLNTILEGESLFNDGTAVVLFTIILGLIMGDHDVSVASSVIKFVKIVVGGAVIGFILGFTVYKILQKINDHLLEVAITIVLTFGAPLLAEAFHFSGIIAIVVAGLIIGNYGRMYSMSEKTRETLETFWEVVDFVINSILFLVIGIELQVFSYQEFQEFWPYILTGIVVVTAARAMVVYPCVWLRNRLIKKDQIPSEWTHILFWGGLKGSLSIALIVGLPEGFPMRHLFLIVGFGVVLFTLIVQAVTMQPLVRRLEMGSS